MLITPLHIIYYFKQVSNPFPSSTPQTIYFLCWCMCSAMPIILPKQIILPIMGLCLGASCVGPHLSVLTHSIQTLAFIIIHKTNTPYFILSPYWLHLAHKTNKTNVCGCVCVCIFHTGKTFAFIIINKTNTTSN